MVIKIQLHSLFDFEANQSLFPYFKKKGCKEKSFSFSVPGKSSISEYLCWRYNIFSSAGGDTSLLQMLPCWFPKSIRRLIQLYEQVLFCLSDNILQLAFLEFQHWFAFFSESVCIVVLHSTPHVP
jgi:hypothetical protein